jgi:choline-sulfatase
MNFFEGSARVPMIVHAPKLFGPKRIAAPVSLVDVLPTVTDLVGAAAPEPLDAPAGRSLLDLCAGGPPSEREVVGEYLGEGAIAPIVMIRRGDLKYVHSPVDPDQLYDLAADPHERVNLAADPDWSVAVKELRARVERDWDMDALYADVVADQARRRLVNSALRTGTPSPWEYTPPNDGRAQYMRNHLDLNVVERATRYPR